MYSKLFLLLAVVVAVALALPAPNDFFYGGGWGRPSFRSVSYSAPVRVAYRQVRPVFAPSRFGGFGGFGYYGDDDDDFFD